MTGSLSFGRGLGRGASAVAGSRSVGRGASAVTGSLSRGRGSSGDENPSLQAPLPPVKPLRPDSRPPRRMMRDVECLESVSRRDDPSRFNRAASSRASLSQWSYARRSDTPTRARRGAQRSSTDRSTPALGAAASPGGLSRKPAFDLRRIQQGVATLAGQKVAIKRPRVRYADGGGEVPLEIPSPREA